MPAIVLLFGLDVMEVSLLNLFHLVVKYPLKKIGDFPIPFGSSGVPIDLSSP